MSASGNNPVVEHLLAEIIASERLIAYLLRHHFSRSPDPLVEAETLIHAATRHAGTRAARMPEHRRLWEMVESNVEATVRDALDWRP
jgi:hypothetical protein